MINENGGISCTLGCWLVAALGGVLGAVLLGLLGGWTFVSAVLAGLVIAGVTGALLNWIMCRPLPDVNEAKPGQKPAARTADAPKAASEAVTTPPPATAAAAPTAAKAEVAPAEKPQNPKTPKPQNPM